MQFQQLAYFVAVADARHFTRAAEAVHVSQPSLSQQIRTLENELGAPLFSRARGNITLTDAGEALLPLARRILADADTARHEVMELAQLRRGRVRLGAPPSLCTGLLPDVLREFHDRHPGIQLLVEEGGSHDLVRELARGSLDLALVVLPLPTPSPALTTVELFQEDLVVVSSVDAEVPPTPLRISDLAGRPMVMFRHGYDLRDLTLAACRAAGFEPYFTVEGGEMDAVLGFVRAGLGLGVVPTMVAARAGGELRVTPLARPGLRRTVALAHRSDVAPPRAARVLQDVLMTAARRAVTSDGFRPAGPVT
ncbi:DNA-binding transcriptional regulator, LysR family [Actinacidiphila rubida]|uniref:DNA-binding transcriptional regulator, LysR family n=2 Tax=Actinacidiphila rubida TaxID=310780 RepID=A0A1H8RS41_9ACTN|nr:LysR family transcriptional regulator [Actinacidiphila rubida]SEO69190.1 DNA-binding transcriptional regulator, LysR family [Actinacidiphila rubida]